MVEVGSVVLPIRLALSELKKNTDEARLLLQKELKDYQINLDLATGQASNKLAQLSAQILNAKSAIAKDAGEAAEFQKQALLLQELVRYKNELAEIEGAGFTDDEVKNAKALAAQLNQLNLDKITNEFDALQKEIQETEQRSGTLTGKLNAAAQAFQENVSKSSLYTQALGQVAGQLSAAGAQVTGFATQASQAAIAFDSARAKVATLSDDADGLAERMRTLSQELGFQSNSTDLLNASYDVLSSGISDTAEIAEVLRASTQGALGGFSDVGTVSDAVTTLVSAYKSMGASAADAQKFVDILAQTQDKGKITIGQYASQIGQVASTAALAGVSVEEMSAAVATATAKGQDSSSAISGVRQAIINILKPTDEAQKYLEKFGIQNAAATLKTEGLVGILERLKAGGASTDELAKIFSDVTGLATVATLANENLGDFKGNLYAMANSAGKAAEAAEKVANSMQGKLTAALNQSNEALVSLGNGVTEAILPLLTALTFLVENFNKLPEPIKEGIGLTIALAGGALTLGGALAGVAAVLPTITTALGLTQAAAVATGTAIAGTTASAVTLQASLVALLPVLAAIGVAAAAVTVVNIIKTTKDMENAAIAIEAATNVIEVSSEAGIQAAFRTKGAVETLNKAKESGRVLNAQEIKDAKKLVAANELRLKGLREELEVAKALPAGNEAQENARAALVAQTEAAIKALDGQNGKLKALIPTNDKAAQSTKDSAKALGELNDKYSENVAKLDAANKLKQAEAAEAVNQGLITEEKAREQALKDETAYLNDKLNLAKSNLTELQALKATEKDPAKLKEINSSILQAESTLADARLAVAQNAANQRQALEEEALKKVEKKIAEAEKKIAQSKSSRTVAVKQEQASGGIDEEEAARRIAQIEQDSIAQTIAARKLELAETRKLKQQGVLSTEEAAQKEAAILQELSGLAIAQVDAEIAAQKQLLNSLANDSADAAKDVQNSQSERIAAIKEAQAQGVLGEKEAAQQIAAINQETAQSNLAIKEKELADLQALRATGDVSIGEAAEREKAIIAEISQLRQSAAEAEISRQNQIKQAKIDALDQELASIQTAAQVQQGQQDLQLQGLQQQNDLLSAQSSLMQAQTGLTQQRLQNAIEEAEANGRTSQAESLRKQLLDEQIRAQEQQAKIQLEQLKLKQEQNKLELESEQRQAAVAVREAEIAIARAQINGASEKELEGLSAILGLRNEQLNALNKQAQAQAKVNQLELQALQINQRKTAEELKQQQIKARASSSVTSSRGSSGRLVAGEVSPGSSPLSSGRSSNRAVSLKAVTNQFDRLGRVGDLTTAFNAANINLGLKTGLTDVRSLGLGDSNREVVGALKELVAVTKANGNRPNLSISNVNDTRTAGQIFSDISRNTARIGGF